MCMRSLLCSSLWMWYHHLLWGFATVSSDDGLYVACIGKLKQTFFLSCFLLCFETPCSPGLPETLSEDLSSQRSACLYHPIAGEAKLDCRSQGAPCPGTNPVGGILWGPRTIDERKKSLPKRIKRLFFWSQIGVTMTWKHSLMSSPIQCSKMVAIS